MGIGDCGTVYVTEGLNAVCPAVSALGCRPVDPAGRSYVATSFAIGQARRYCSMDCSLVHSAGVGRYPTVPGSYVDLIVLGAAVCRVSLSVHSDFRIATTSCSATPQRRIGHAAATL
jgi:hypothetical protein